MSARRWWPALLWAAVVLTLTSVPNPNVPALTGGDKVVHVIMYGVFAALLVRVWPIGRRRAMLVAVTLVGLALFAAADEWHQRFIPGRSADVADWAADVGGATLAVALTSFVSALRRQESA